MDPQEKQCTNKYGHRKCDKCYIIGPTVPIWPNGIIDDKVPIGLTSMIGIIDSSESREVITLSP